jgi:hypothetical protein
MTMSDTLDLAARVMVDVPAKSGRDKSWARVVDGIDRDATTGNDWDGPWLERGATVDLPVGTLVVDFDLDKDRKGRSDKDDYSTGLRVVMPHGKLQVIDSSQKKGWAQELRAVGRKWLDMDVRGRILTACRMYLENHPEDVPGNSAINEGRRLRQAWIAALESPADPRAEAIAEIRTMMAEHGITADDLKG